MSLIPDASDLWSGIAGHFDSFSQVISEFIDNSIANFEGKKRRSRSISITIQKGKKDRMFVRIEDTGSGIPDLLTALRIGDRSQRQSPLNEHGFGLKHALASSNPENDDWRIYTRTKSDCDRGEYKLASAPYKYDLKPQILNDSRNTKWPGQFNGPGTMVEFTCSLSLFNTIQRGIPGKAKIERCLEYLAEEIGYVYSRLITKGKATLTIESDELENPINIGATAPNWKGFYPPSKQEIGTDRIDLGSGKVTIEYVFGEMGKSRHVKHYRRNISTSGVEVRVNGRVLMSNVFRDIWGLQPHPLYNHFLVIVDIISNDPDKLPQTRTSKNGIRSGDEKLEKLYEWILGVCPAPKKELTAKVGERELIKRLADDIMNKTPSSKTVKTDQQVFKQLDSPVLVDLYVFMNQQTFLYEAKKGKADAQAFYQLLMYWDGAVFDGISPTEGILVANKFSPSIDDLIKMYNDRSDANDRKYKFRKKTWKALGVKLRP